jgi:hypothetical protein
MKNPQNYEVVELGMLKTTNLKTTRQSKMLDNKPHGSFHVDKVMTPMAIQVTLPRSWQFHYLFYVNLFEPYSTSRPSKAVIPTQVISDYDNFIAEDYTIKEIMGNSYNK